MRRRRREEEGEDPNMTPLLDVVFILLIFFVVTSSFVKESGIEVNRPRAVTAAPQQLANILIAIDANDEVWIQRRRVDVRAVRANVERLLAENPQGSVVIQADAESRNGTFVQVMDQARLAGAENIAVAAQRPEE
ncbi:MAG: biopolymer transporter ExbD [Myxococcota bacterium]|nr:biopolymer transporter ExbD [Myxococcota bacterium]